MMGAVFSLFFTDFALGYIKGEIAPTLKGVKILAVIAPQKFRDEELFVPKKYWETRGGKVDVASLGLKPGQYAHGMLGARARITVSFLKALRRVKMGYYDVFYLVGGTGSVIYADTSMKSVRAMKETLSYAIRFGKIRVLAAICLGPSVLARLGLIRGATVAGWKGSAKIINRNGARWVPDPVFVCDALGKVRLVTGAGPFAARTLAEKVEGVLLRKALR